ncbi:hypothetical protein JCM3765_001789 [Sporobolomyces pararoseus]
MPPWSNSKTSISGDEEEAASLTRNASPWSRSLSVEALSPVDNFSDNFGSNAEKELLPTRRGWTTVPEVRRVRGSRLWIAVSLLLASCGALLHFGGYTSRSLESVGGGTDRGKPWEKFGNAQLVDLSVKEEKLPICERTMLVDWRSFQFGFGSTATTILQAGIVAKMHGYTMLFDRGANKYGRYLDFFDPAPLDCHAPEQFYDPSFYRQHKEDGMADNVGSVITDQFDRPEVNHLLVGTDDIHPLNHHTTALVYPNMTVLDSLPPLDASRPVPVTSNVPQVFAESFDRYSALSAEHFRFNSLMQSKVNHELSRLGLDKEETEVLTVGVHWRGGDKLERECASSSQLSCGNVTHHCATAWDSLPPADLAATQAPKPRLLLMTTEPDALDLFRADSSCQRFDVQPLEDLEKKQSFVQDQWNSKTDLERLEDAQSMLVGSDLLSNHVDSAVVSPNSNLARIIMTRAGPGRVKEQGKIRSVDIYWHPVHYPPFKRTETWGGCDGTWGGCWPHD